MKLYAQSFQPGLVVCSGDQCGVVFQNNKWKTYWQWVGLFLLMYCARFFVNVSAYGSYGLYGNHA